MNKIINTRIRDEFIRVMDNQHRAEGIKMLMDMGVMDYLIPEFNALKGVKQDPEHHPEGDVFTHTLQALENYQGTVNGAFATLLHDIGKPMTAIEVDGEIRFPNHEDAGAEMTEAILSRLEFKQNDIDEIVYCIRNHMRMAQFLKLSRQKQNKFMTEPHFTTLVAVAKADAGKRYHKKFREILDRIKELE